MEPNKNLEFYTTDDLLAMLHTSRPSISRWIREKKIPAYRIGKKFLFPKKQFDKWVNDQIFNP